MIKINVYESKIKDIFNLYKYLKTKVKFTSILESLGEYNETKSRYSILGAHPCNILKGGGGEYRLFDIEKEFEETVDYINVLDSWINLPKIISKDKQNIDEFDNIFQTGVIGYISYNEKNKFEKLSDNTKSDVKLPTVFLVKYSILFVFDNKINSGYWVYNKDRFNEDYILSIENESLNFLKCINSENNIFSNNNNFEISSLKNDFNYDKYIEGVSKTIEYIKNGDIFQANITVRFSANYNGDPINLYEELRKSTPNPFFAYLDFDFPVISTSPERFMKINQTNIKTNPIKGTIRCKEDGEDKLFEIERSEKDRAENIMIVDLMRNDIGRFSKQGSVKVSSLCEIIQFNLLYHMESIVEGELKNDTKLSQILKAVFPAGSISGAPKIRAMEIINEIEETSREVYTGLIGFFGENGYIDTSVAIRVIYFDSEKLYFHAGGGITSASIPENEYKELNLKVESIKNTLLKFKV